MPPRIIAADRLTGRPDQPAGSRLVLIPIRGAFGALLREHVCHKSLAVPEAKATTVGGEVGVADLRNPQLHREQRRSECVIRKMAGSVYNTPDAG